MNTDYHMILRDFWAFVYNVTKERAYKATNFKLIYIEDKAPAIADVVLKRFVDISNEEKEKHKAELLKINFSQFLEKKKNKF